MTSFIEFDPLKGEENIDTEILTSAKKRQIKNILKSYVGTYDPFSELIQNAMDAVDKRELLQAETSYKKKIWLKIDLQKNTFSITDNGIGFNEKEFKAFLAPNISFKNAQNSRGNKGVGATYIAYGFNFLQLGTRTSNFEFIGELEKGRDWVEDNAGIVTRPVVKNSKLIHSIFNTINQGSTFTIKFGGNHTRPKDLTWFSAHTPAQWTYLLLLKTPLGCLDFQNDIKSKMHFDICIVDTDGQEQELTNQISEYIYPHRKISACAEIKEIVKTQDQLIKQGRDASKLPPKFDRLNGIYEFFTSEDLKKLPTRRVNDVEMDLIDQFQIEAYGFFSYSTSIWDELNDKVAKLRKGYRILKGGLQLANNYMVQGELITIPLTSNVGYQNQAHIIVHFKNADPDLGRKGFQPELKELAEDIAVGIVNKLKRWRKQLKKDSGIKPIITNEIELHNWIRDQEKHEEKNPLILNNPNFFKPVNEISISSKPQSEQDAVVLFNQLVAGGVIRGIKLLATSQNAQYDCIFKFVVNPPEENHIFDKEINPLGIEQLGMSVGMISPPKVLEYKYNLDALFQEFENEEKFEKDISLAVAWNLGNQWRKNYEVTSLLDLDNLHHRYHHGLTHIITSSTNRFFAIILSELIEYLNNVEGVQEYHKITYDENMFIE